MHMPRGSGTATGVLHVKKSSTALQVGRILISRASQGSASGIVIDHLKQRHQRQASKHCQEAQYPAQLGLPSEQGPREVI